MKLDPVRAAGVVLALALLVIVAQQTLEAVRSSGVWERRTAAAAAPDPYARLEHLLAAARAGAPVAVTRDPFTIGPAPAAPRTPATPVARAPKAPAPPVLTAIFWDDDPRALLRWDGANYSVRTDSVVGGYRIARITATQVVLERGTETLVLTVRP